MHNGVQVIFVPHEANGDQTHVACRAGFVVGNPMGETVFVRYWIKDKIGKEIASDRHGQATHVRSLVQADSIPQSELEAKWLL